MSTEIARLESSSALGPVCTDLSLAKSESDFCSDTESNSDADIDSDNYSEDYDDDDNESDIGSCYDPDDSWDSPFVYGMDSVLL